MDTFEIESDRQCAGSASGETHRIMLVRPSKRVGQPPQRTCIAVHRRRDFIEDLAAELTRQRDRFRLAIAA